MPVDTARRQKLADAKQYKASEYQRGLFARSRTLKYVSITNRALHSASQRIGAYLAVFVGVVNNGDGASGRISERGDVWRATSRSTSRT